MNMNLAAIQDSFAADTNILILSHTVDPETDDVATLKAYAERATGWRRVGMAPGLWLLV